MCRHRNRQWHAFVAAASARAPRRARRHLCPVGFGGHAAQAFRRAEGLSSPWHSASTARPTARHHPAGGEPARPGDQWQTVSASTALRSPIAKTTPALVAQGTIEGGLLTDPQDVAALGRTPSMSANEHAPRALCCTPCRAIAAAARPTCFISTACPFASRPMAFIRARAGSDAGRQRIFASPPDRARPRSLQPRALLRRPDRGNRLPVPAGAAGKHHAGSSRRLWVAGHASLFSWRDFARMRPSRAVAGLPRQPGERRAAKPGHGLCQ